MTAITLEAEARLETEALWAVAESARTGSIDALADCARVWCTSSPGPARVVGGFCEHCGARDHDDL
ncbi:hypothetical protein [Georgenia sp. SYP-B2076]|uniref:hypothetical protein n=1 Tax=Georgenia sp. SYP-B2076 TaxID=2495881 RepID=UPI000F8F059A|nr:hypothetical protein [Georgenia sp. SYP-B2076]